MQVPAPAFDWLSGALVLATVALAYFTWKLWRATGTLVRDTEASARHQQRAYVGIDSMSLTSLNLHRQQYTPPQTKPGKRMRDKIDVQMKNFGATPANGVDLTASLWTSGAKLPENAKLDEIIDGEIRKRVEGAFCPKHSIFPGQGAPIDVYAPDLTPFRNALADKGIDVFVFGRIDYVDIFGEKHSTRFCYYYDTTQQPDREFVPFERYNEAT